MNVWRTVAFHADTKFGLTVAERQTGFRLSLDVGTVCSRAIGRDRFGKLAFFHQGLSSALDARGSWPAIETSRLAGDVPHIPPLTWRLVRPARLAPQIGAVHPVSAPYSKPSTVEQRSGRLSMFKRPNAPFHDNRTLASTRRWENAESHWLRSGKKLPESGDPLRGCWKLGVLARARAVARPKFGWHGPAWQSLGGRP
jgi:hypothetical protein